MFLRVHEEVRRIFIGLSLTKVENGALTKAPSIGEGVTDCDGGVLCR